MMHWFRGLRVREVMLVIAVVALVMGWAIDHARLAWQRDWAVARWESSYNTFKQSGDAIAGLLGWLEEMRAGWAACEERAAAGKEPGSD